MVLRWIVFVVLFLLANLASFAFGKGYGYEKGRVDILTGIAAIAPEMLEEISNRARAHVAEWRLRK